MGGESCSRQLEARSSTIRRGRNKMLETGWEDLGAPADSIPQTGLGASVTLLPPRGMLTLRGDLNSPEFSSALDTITGTAVPEMRRAEINGENGALWMSPDELLVFVPYTDRERRLSEFEQALSGSHALAVDVSDARVIYRVSALICALCFGLAANGGARGFPLGSLKAGHCTNAPAAVRRPYAACTDPLLFRCHSGCPC